MKLRQVLVRHTLLAAVVAASGGATTLAPLNVDYQPSPHTVTDADVVAELSAGRDCWAGGDGHPFPHGVIVTLPGKRPTNKPARVGFAVVFGPDSQPNTGDERPGTVHMFCATHPEEFW